MMVGLAGLLYLLHQKALAQSERELTNLGHSLVGQARDMIRSVDIVLRDTREGLMRAKQAGEVQTPAYLHEHFRQRIAGVPQIRSMALATAGSDVIGHSLTPSPQVAISDTSSFRAHLLHASNKLHVAEPRQSRVDGQWGVALSLRMEDADGQFDGIVAAVIDPSVVQQFYKGIELGEGTAVSLFRADGILLARWPQSANSIGLSFSNDPIFTELLDEMGHGFALLDSRVDNQRRLVFAQRVGDYPFVIAASRDEASAFEAWRHTALALVAATSLLLVGAGWLMLRLATQEAKRRMAEAELVGTTQRLRLIDVASPVGLYVSDPSGLLSYVNPAYTQLLGVQAVRLVGQAWIMLLHQDDREAVSRSWQQAVERGEPFAMEYRCLCPDGRMLWVSNRAEYSPSQAAQGAYVGSIEDITARREHEQLLRETLSLQKAVLDGTAYSIVSTDRSGLIRSFNRGAEQMLGFSAAEMVGKATPARFHDLQEVVARAAALSVELGEPIPVGFEVFVAKARLEGVEEREWSYIRKDGQRIPVLLSVTPLRDELGEIDGYLGVAHDLSEFHKVDKLKREFVSIVSHELRTPLTSIRGSLGLVAGGIGGALPERANELVKIALQNAERLVRLINDILDIERIDAGQLTLRVQCTEVMPLLEQALADNQGYADHHGVRLQCFGQVYGALVEVDVDRFGQVMANLLSNAIKFSHSGGGVEVSVIRDGTRLRIEVCDHGPGIAPAFRDKLFERFSQADSTDARRRDGTGLGLAICKSLMAQMHGEIGCDSSEGAGSCFWLSLPLQGLPTGPADMRPPSLVPRILLLEQDESCAAHLARPLVEAGFPVELVYEANEALLRWESGRFGVALVGPRAVSGGEGRLEQIMSRDHQARAILLLGDTPTAMPVDARLPWPLEPQQLLAGLRRVLVGLRSAQVLLIDHDVGLQTQLGAVLPQGVALDSANTLTAARHMLCRRDYDLVLMDPALPDGDGLALLPLLYGLPMRPEIVLHTSDAALDTGLTGALHRLPKDGSVESIADLINQKLRRRRGQEDTP
ncbi:PAS domain S-box protein [Chitinimonas prasina]|uniref:PAS domain S-box protein n=1 Tax=Chitinimonas prasina TaxID=1434937 RepID=UPI0024E0AD0B|nr:PAS domain S-box protein [Chitinimonas prasina]